MNALAEQLPHQFVAEDTSVDAALVQVDWQPQGPTTWKLDTRHGDAILEEIAHRDNWRQFQLSGGGTPRPENNRVLHHNHCLRGPAKFVARTGHSPVCRLDVPDDLAGSASDPFEVGSDRGLNVCSSWVQAVTEIAAGRVRPVSSIDCIGRDSTSVRTSATDSAIATEIKQAGWSVALDNSQTTIHLQLPGVYRQLTLERDKRGGIRLNVNLLDLSGLDDDCLSAVSLLRSKPTPACRSCEWPYSKDQNRNPQRFMPKLALAPRSRLVRCYCTRCKYSKPPSRSRRGSSILSATLSSPVGSSKLRPCEIP